MVHSVQGIRFGLLHIRNQVAFGNFLGEAKKYHLLLASFTPSVNRSSTDQHIEIFIYTSGKFSEI